MTKIVEDTFSCSLPNERCRSIKRKQPLPYTLYTKCPKLDNTIQSRLPKSAKDADRASACIQTLVLDATTPLINMLELARKGTLNSKEVAESAQQALRLLGNASANISMDRRRKATQHLNTELATLVDEKESFKDAAPMLFGKTFDQRAKEHIEEVRSLKKSSTFQRGQPFQRGHSPMSQGGGNNRGRGKQGTFSPREKLSKCKLYNKFNKCIELYKCSMRKRKQCSKHASRHSAGSQGARKSVKGHQTISTDSDAREHTKSREASKHPTQGVRDNTSQHRILCAGDAHSASQLEWGHPSSSRDYQREDNATSGSSHSPPVLCRQDQPVLGLWELCSKFLSLFYSEFLPKFHQYAYFYSFYASDFIIIPQLQLINKFHLIYNNQQNSITYAKKNCTQLFINLTVNNCIIILTILS